MARHGERLNSIRRAATAAILVVAIALGGCGGDSPDTVPSFEAVDTATGSAVTPADLRGQPALLAAWATWCVPCERELPALDAAYEATFMPFSVLIDAEGRVQERWLGSLDPDGDRFRVAIAEVASP